MTSRRRAVPGTDSTLAPIASSATHVIRSGHRPGTIPPVPRKKRWRHWLYAATLLVAGSAGSASAETFTVTNSNDSGAGSLRQAMLDAAANADASNTINFAASLAGGDTITLASALPNIGKNLTIDGAGNTSLAISGNGQFRPFFVETGTVSISSLTIQNATAKGGNGGNGYAGGGGGLGAGGAIFVNTGAAVTVQAVTFSNNTAQGGNGGVRDTNIGSGGGGGGSIFGTNGSNASGDNGGNGAGPTGGTGGLVGGNSGGDGGFGSGGGGGGYLFDIPPAKGGDGGDGGWGAGGGGAGGIPGASVFNTAIGGTGGFGAGSGGNPFGSGGGGSAYGGAIFVRSGGSLTVVDSGISGGSTVAGTGSSTGAAAGTGLFLNDTTINYNVTTGNTVTISDTIAGTGGVVKDGAGTLALGGNSAIFQNSGLVTISDGAISGNTTQLNNRDIVNNAELIFNQAFDSTYSGVVTGTGQLTKSGIGTLSITGANTYEGGTNLNNGVLGVGAGGSLGTGTIQANGGWLQFNDSNQSLSNDISLNQDLTVNQLQVSNSTLSGDLSGDSKLTANGAGALWLSGDNSSFTGDVDIQNFMLILTNDNSLNQGNNVHIAHGSQLATYLASHAIIGDLTGSGNINLNNAGKVTVGTSNDSTFDGQITNTGTFVKAGNGKLTLTADQALSHTGVTEVTQGTLIGSTAAFNDHDIITNNSRVEFDQETNGTYTGVISGNGQLYKSGAGVVTLDGANTYSGGTTIFEGTLRLGSHGSLSSSTSLNISPNAVFDLNDQSQTITFLVGSGSVLLGSGELTTNTSITTTYSGVISGTGSLIKNGLGNLTLSGTNTYSGGTTINDGRINITQDANLGNASGGLNFNGGTLGVNSLWLTTNRNVFLDTNGGTINLGNNSVLFLNGIISGSGDLEVSGPGYAFFSGANTYTGDTSVSGSYLGIESDANLGANTNQLNLTMGTLMHLADITSNRTINVASQGTIDTNGFNSTFSGPVTGYGLFVKTGDGRLNLTGDSTFTGDTQIQNGNLAINGTWAGGMLVNGGVLSGAGTIAGNVHNESVVAPGNSIDTLTINQNYSQGDNGRLDIEIAPGAEHTDVLNVLGEVHLDGELNVTGQGLTGFSIGDRYTFLYGSGGVNGTFGTVTDDLAFLDIQLDYTNPYAVSFVLANSASFTSAASTPNQFQVGTGLDNGAPGATGDFANLISQITLLTTPEAQAAYDNLSGEIYASNSAASIEQAQSLLRNLAERLRQNATSNGSLLAVRMQTPDQAFQMVSTGGLNQQDDIIRLAHSQSTNDRFSHPVTAQSVAEFLQPVSHAQTWDGWIEGYGQSGRIGSNGNASGIGYSFGATNFGIGYYLDEVTTVGVLGGYANSTVRGGGSGQDRSEVETGQVGLYGRTSIGQNYLLGVINYGNQSYDTNRIVNVGGTINTADGSYNANQLGVLLEAGQNQSLGNFVVQPLVGLQFINLWTDSFAENATGGVGLNVDDQSDSSLRGSVGGRLLRPMTLRGGRTFVPEMQARYMYEFLDSSQSIGATFAGAAPGAPFAIQGVSAGNSFIVYGAGGSLVLNDSFSIYGHYIGQASDQMTSHTGTGGFQFRW